MRLCLWTLLNILLSLHNLRVSDTPARLFDLSSKSFRIPRAHFFSLTSMPQNPPRLSPHPRSSRSFPCTLSACKGRFSRRRDVRRHENTVHGAEKKHCGYNGCKFRGTVRLDVLRKHLRNHHSSSFLTGELLRQMSAKLASAESTD